MVSDLRDRDQVERFLRTADAAELMAQRHLIEETPGSVTAAEAERLVARIAYELRFRLPQSL